MWLVWPLWVFYSFKRCRQQPNAWSCWQELWTIRQPHFISAPIWIHAVSLGETQAAFILIKQLRASYPHQPIFFTGGNSSAINAAKKQAVNQVHISFLPPDYAWLRRRLFNAVKPKLLILMETEFWPNLLIEAHRKQVPVALIQARLSLSSRKNYPKYAQPLLQQLLNPIAFVAAQTQSDAQALIALGVQPDHCHLLGNIKYDFSLPEQLNAQCLTLKHRIGSRWIWAAGSTHAGEEKTLILAHQQLASVANNPLLLLVPRHPSYFNQLANQLSAKNIRFVRWSEWYDQNNDLDADVTIVLVDTLGQLMLCYQVAQVCFVGGSLVPWGGHNLLEPAALAKPVLTGPYNHNFSEIERGLISAQGIIKASDEAELSKKLIQLYQYPEQGKQIGLNAQVYFQQQQGATKKMITELKKYIAN